jgi:curved DNA-binding protein CbpA
VSIILNEAYDTLMDENERAVYDRDLRELQVRVAFPKSADCFPTRD